MNSQRQKPAVPTIAKDDVPQRTQSSHEVPDDRYPGSFFRIPGVPAPGKATCDCMDAGGRATHGAVAEILAK
jgi:hypothetical protein